MKSGSLKLLEPSGPVQACNGFALSVFYLYSTISHKHTRAHTHTHTHTQHDRTSARCIFNLVLRLMATNKGQSAVPSANNCQGELQTPQSVTVPATAWSPIRSVVFPAETSEIIKGLLNLYLAKLRQNSKQIWKLMSCVLMDTYMTFIIRLVKLW